MLELLIAILVGWTIVFGLFFYSIYNSVFRDSIDKEKLNLYYRRMSWRWRAKKLQRKLTPFLKK